MTSVISLGLADAMTPASDSLGRASKRGKPRNPAVAARNMVIDRNRHLTNGEICRRLDLEFLRRDGIAFGMPEGWSEDYGMTSYVAAYKHRHCRNKVDAMISKRRAVADLP